MCVCVCVCVCVVVFCLQAEDGIRDLVRSRGLGDVYKRQAIATWLLTYAYDYTTFLIAALGVGIAGGSFAVGIAYVSKSVSYTLLTLPTSDLV